MEHIVEYQGRGYVFYSKNDVDKANKIFPKVSTLEEFENELEKEKIDFVYNLADLTP